MRINNNISAMNTLRQYSANTNATNKSMEKLSSGMKINRAGDDAAGLAISEKMRSQIRGLEMASDNSQNAISLVQTAEGALSETHAILQRMNELSVQSASDTNESIDRDALQAEFSELLKEIDNIGNQTAFNNQKLLDGSVNSAVSTNIAETTVFTVAGVESVEAGGAAGEIYTITDAVGGADLVFTRTSDGATATAADPGAGEGTITVAEWGISIDLGPGYVADSLDTETIEIAASAGLQIQTGANSGETLQIDIGDMRAAALGVNALDISSQTGADTAITAVSTAINDVSTQRASLGAYQNRLDHKINNLNTSAENLQAAESNIRDVDMAEEMISFTKSNILLQAAQSMLAQANSQPQGVLQLLR